MDFFFIPVVLSISAFFNRYLCEKVVSNRNDFGEPADSRASWFRKDIAWERSSTILRLADEWCLSSVQTESGFS